MVFRDFPCGFWCYAAILVREAYGVYGSHSGVGLGDVHVGRAEPFCGALSSGDRHCRQHVVFPVYRLIEGKGIATALDGIGRSTLGIYWLQTFLLEYLFNSLGFYVPMIWTFVLPPCLALVELVVCYRLVLLFKKNVYIRLFVLGER